MSGSSPARTRNQHWEEEPRGKKLIEWLSILRLGFLRHRLIRQLPGPLLFPSSVFPNMYCSAVFPFCASIVLSVQMALMRQDIILPIILSSIPTLVFCSIILWFHSLVGGMEHGSPTYAMELCLLYDFCIKRCALNWLESC